jgi:hypothetical protein
MNPHVTGINTHKESIIKDLENTLETNLEIKENLAVATKRMADDVDENSIAGAHARTKKLVPEKKTKSKQVQRAEKGVFVRKESADLADSFNERQGNGSYQLPRDGLINLAQCLGDTITPDTPAEDLIRMVQNELKVGNKETDVTQVDKAFEFLIEVIQSKLERATGLESTFLEKLLINVTSTKIKHFEINKDKIIAGHNLIDVAYRIRSEDKSSAETLDHLRTLSNIDNKLDIFKLNDHFKSLGYDYKAILDYLNKIFKALRKELTEDRESDSEFQVVQKHENPHLNQLLQEVRNMQAMKGVYKQADREIRTIFVFLNKILHILN